MTTILPTDKLDIHLNVGEVLLSDKDSKTIKDYLRHEYTDEEIDRLELLMNAEEGDFPVIGGQCDTSVN